MKRFMVAGAFAAAILLIAPSKGNAQFAVDHFVSAVDQTYDSVNYGLNGASETPGAPGAGWECVNYYVYSAQEIIACGACNTSPNGSVRVRLSTNLINNPITATPFARGVVKILYSSGAFGCDPTTATPRAGVKTFRSNAVGEIELADGLGLSASELNRLHSDCTAVHDIGSGGPGITSCGPSD